MPQLITVERPDFTFAPLAGLGGFVNSLQEFIRQHQQRIKEWEEKQRLERERQAQTQQKAIETGMLAGGGPEGAAVARALGANIRMLPPSLERAAQTTQAQQWAQEFLARRQKEAFDRALQLGDVATKMRQEREQKRQEMMNTLLEAAHTIGKQIVARTPEEFYTKLTDALHDIANKYGGFSFLEGEEMAKAAAKTVIPIDIEKMSMLIPSVFFERAAREMGGKFYHPSTLASHLSGMFPLAQLEERSRAEQEANRAKLLTIAANLMIKQQALNMRGISLANKMAAQTFNNQLNALRSRIAQMLNASAKTGGVLSPEVLAQIENEYNQLEAGIQQLQENEAYAQAQQEAQALQDADEGPVMWKTRPGSARELGMGAYTTPGGWSIYPQAPQSSFRVDPYKLWDVQMKQMELMNKINESAFNQQKWFYEAANAEKNAIYQRYYDIITRMHQRMDAIRNKLQQDLSRLKMRQKETTKMQKAMVGKSVEATQGYKTTEYLASEPELRRNAENALALEAYNAVTQIRQLRGMYPGYNFPMITGTDLIYARKWAREKHGRMLLDDGGEAPMPQGQQRVPARRPTQLSQKTEQNAQDEARRQRIQRLGSVIGGIARSINPLAGELVDRMTKRAIQQQPRMSEQDVQNAIKQLNSQMSDVDMKRAFSGVNPYVVRNAHAIQQRFERMQQHGTMQHSATPQTQTQQQAQAPVQSVRSPNAQQGGRDLGGQMDFVDLNLAKTAISPQVTRFAAMPSQNVWNAKSKMGNNVKVWVNGNNIFVNVGGLNTYTKYVSPERASESSLRYIANEIANRYIGDGNVVEGLTKFLMSRFNTRRR